LAFSVQELLMTIKWTRRSICTSNSFTSRKGTSHSPWWKSYSYTSIKETRHSTCTSNSFSFRKETWRSPFKSYSYMTIKRT
jgi:hypothetical protein